MRLRRERKRKRVDRESGSREDTRERAKERKPVSANGTDLSYRLLSSDASGITFVRFAGVDDVVAHGVGVISTREGTYLPITVLLSLLPSARTYACIYSPSFLPPAFPSPSRFLFPPFYLFPSSVFARLRSGTLANFARIPTSRSCSPPRIHLLSIFAFTLICTAT